MMELGRIARHDPGTIDGGGRLAAVIAPVVVRDGDTHVLFTKRADHLGEHPGQMSWPGGGHEPHDSDMTATALREVDEEIGLRSSEVDLVGRLDDIQTVTDYVVRPFVAQAPARQYVPDEREVAEVVLLPVAELVDPDNYDWEYREHPHDGRIRLDYFHVDGYTVWGATGRMLAQLLELTTDWRRPAESERFVEPDPDLTF